MLERNTRRGEDGLLQRLRTVDGLLLDRQQAWLVVSRAEDDVVGLLLGEGGTDEDVPLIVCRAVLPDGTLILGAVDPERDELLSEILPRDRCGRV